MGVAAATIHCGVTTGRRRKRSPRLPCRVNAGTATLWLLLLCGAGLLTTGCTGHGWFEFISTQMNDLDQTKPLKSRLDAGESYYCLDEEGRINLPDSNFIPSNGSSARRAAPSRSV